MYGKSSSSNFVPNEHMSLKLILLPTTAKSISEPSLATPFALEPKRMTSLIKVAEEVNKLADVFEQIQKQYSDETENSSKTISSLLEPFLIIFIGLFVGIILIAMYLPLFEIGSGMK